MSDRPKDHVASLIVRNSKATTAAMALRLGPQRATFSGDYVMEPGDSLRIRAWGTSPGELTIELADQGIVVRDWPGSVVCVSSVRVLGGSGRAPGRARPSSRIAPAISIRERLHPLDDFEEEDTKPGEPQR